MQNYPQGALMRRAGCLILALVMVLSLFGTFNVQPSRAATAEGTDLAVTGLYVQDKTVRVSLYDLGGTKPDSAQVSLYKDGRRVHSKTESMSWDGKTAVLEFTLGEAYTKCELSVTVYAKGDVDRRNDNLSVTIGTSSTFPTETTEETVPTTPTTPTSPTTPPTTPVTVKPVAAQAAAEETSVALTWGCQGQGDQEPDRYEITFNGQTYSDTAAGSRTFTGLTPGSSYSYTVKAYYMNEEKSTATGIVTTKVQTIAAVTNVQAAVTSDNRIQVSWDPITGPRSYKILRRDASGNTASFEASGTPFFDSTAQSGVTYTYSVTAVWASGEAAAATSNEVTRYDEVPGGKADLVVTDIRWTPANPKAGDQVVFTAVVKNQGNATTVVISGKESIIGVRFSVGGRDSSPFTWSDQYTQMLAPGAQVELTANGGQNGAAWTATGEGSFQVYAWVDDQSRIEDSNRDNNVYQKTMTVSSQPPVEVPSGDTGNGTVYVKNDIPSGLNRSGGIAVTVNNQLSGVFDVTVNNSRFWDTVTTDTTPVTVFELSREDTTAKVRVALSRTMTSVVVRPVSKGVTPVIREENGQRYAEFEISKWGSYSVEFNGEMTKALQLFVNPPYKEYYDRGDSAYAGWTYVDLGTSGGFGNQKVYGSGAVIAERGGPVCEVQSGARFYGVTVVNKAGATAWNMQIADKGDVEFNYFHLFAYGRNSDGITIQSSNNVRVYNSYLRTWDDGVVLKNYTGSDTHDITVEGCVFWTDLAQSMEIGAETNKGNKGDPQIYNVWFRNIDVIHACHKPAISIHNMDNARVHDITWENVTVEDAAMGLNSGKEDGWPILIDLTNVKGGELDGTAGSWTSVQGRGFIYNVTLKNIRVLSWRNSAGVIPGIRLANSTSGGSISNITVQGLYYRNSDGSTMKIDGSNVSQLCGWNPTEGSQGAQRVGYEVLSFVDNGDVTLPDPGGVRAQSAGGLAAQVAQTTEQVLETIRAVGSLRTA